MEDERRLVRAKQVPQPGGGSAGRAEQKEGFHGYGDEDVLGLETDAGGEKTRGAPGQGRYGVAPGDGCREDVRQHQEREHLVALAEVPRRHDERQDEEGEQQCWTFE